MKLYCVKYCDGNRTHHVAVRKCISAEEAISVVKEEQSFGWSSGLLGGSPIPCWIGGNGVWSAKECDCCYFGHRC